MISLTHAIILGFIEGLTEFLPISSTGHLIIANYFLGNDLTSQLVQTFTISIQLGAILAVITIYWQDLFKLDTIKLLLYGFIPTALIALIAKPFMGEILALPIIVAVSLILGGIAIIAIELNIKNKSKSPNSKPAEKEIIVPKDAMKLGLWQSIAIIPGVSRSGAMIMGGLLMNIKRDVIAKYTFLIAVPTMIAATTLSLKDSIDLFTRDSVSSLIVGFVTAMITAYIVIRLFIPYIKKHDFIPFGIYRIVVGILLLIILL